MARPQVGQLFITLAFAIFQICECFRRPENNFLARLRPHRTPINENLQKVLVENIPLPKELTNVNCDLKSRVNTKSRISNGCDSKDASQWPFFVTLVKPGPIICGGVILTDKIVGTSKSCFYRAETGAYVLSNSTSRAQKDGAPVMIAKHACGATNYSLIPSINGGYRSFQDFLMISTNGSLLDIDDTINKPVSIKEHSTDMISKDEAACYIVTHSNDEGELRVKSAEVVLEECWNQNEGQFCFSGKKQIISTCDNDSGSPIVCYDEQEKTYTLVGLVSTVLRYCDPKMPDRGIQNVATNFSYIHDVVKAYDECLEKLEAAETSENLQ